VRKILLLSVGAAGLLAASGGAVAADIKPWPRPATTVTASTA